MSLLYPVPENLARKVSDIYLVDKLKPEASALKHSSNESFPIPPCSRANISVLKTSVNKCFETMEDQDCCSGIVPTSKWRE
jgi:hypothetical protein